MSNDLKAGLRTLFIALVCAVVIAAFGWIGVVDAKQRDDSERITKLEVVVPRIEKSLEAIDAKLTGWDEIARALGIRRWSQEQREERGR